MALTDRGRTESIERLLDRLSYDDHDERPRLRRALEMAVDALQHCRTRIVAAQALYGEYDRAERCLPVLVQADYNDDNAYAMEKALAYDVFGPVLLATRISMPVTLTHEPIRGDIGLLYPQRNQETP